jgi:putative tryptophan/tyrosine transport system substrate-binding protein
MSRAGCTLAPLFHSNGDGALQTLVSRRAVIAGLSWPGVVARPALAQTGGVPRVGFMGFATPAADAPTLAALREGLREQGLPDGAGVRVEARHAGADVTVAARMIEELTALPVSVFVSPGPAATRLLHRMTRLPIVAIGLLPGDTDLFASVAQPGGSVTGLSSFGEGLSAKRIELLREVFPQVNTIGVLHNTIDPVFRDWGVQTEAAITKAGLDAVRGPLTSTSAEELGAQLDMLKARNAQAVVVIRDFLTQSMFQEIIRQGHARGLALVAEQKLFVQAGALMSYGPDINDLFRRAAGHVGRILRGTAPGQIPIEFPARFELALNLRTARDSGHVIPPTVLARADDLVE